MKLIIDDETEGCLLQKNLCSLLTMSTDDLLSNQMPYLVNGLQSKHCKCDTNVSFFPLFQLV